jgi:flagellar biosynthesis GTPase FlhF
MSAWEYFVGWLLEVTTHMKYWDYSHRRFNLKGRICLGNCLWWGVASYLVIYWLHPATQRLFLLMPTLVRQIVALVLALLVLADTIATIRELALLRAMLTRAEEARVQLELMKAELHQSLDEKRSELQSTLGEKRSELQSTAEKARQSLDEKRSTLQATLESTAEKARQSAEQRRENRDLAVLEANRRKIMEQAERYSRRFLKHYGKMSSRYFSNPLTELRRKAGQLRHLKRDDRTRG